MILYLWPNSRLGNVYRTHASCFSVSPHVGSEMIFWGTCLWREEGGKGKIRLWGNPPSDLHLREVLGSISWKQPSLIL